MKLNGGNMKDYEHDEDYKEFIRKFPETDEVYPRLTNLSSAFFYDTIPNPKERKPLELIEIDLPKKNFAEIFGAMVSWNTAWEAGQYKSILASKNLPKKWNSFINTYERNIYLIPRYKDHSYGKYSLLHHLMPLDIIKKHNLPFVTNANWPMVSSFGDGKITIFQYDEKLQKAFAEYIWPFLNTRSAISSFSKDDPIKLLAHNLDYWVGPSYQYAESEILGFGFLNSPSSESEKRMRAISKDGPYEEVDVHYPRFGGSVWEGKHEAKLATSRIVDRADKEGRLREILDLVQSNRIEDDFSSRWSYEKEDFERKIYSKRNKVKVIFVELRDTVPILNQDSEIHENLMWEDFMGILNEKEKSITVCLRNGETSLSTIANELGYANHSPISKALEKIRNKTQKYFENSR